MSASFLRTDWKIEEIFERWYKTVYRIAVLFIYFRCFDHICKKISTGGSGGYFFRLNYLIFRIISNSSLVT